MYYCLVSSARNLENEAKAVNRLSKGLQNCVKVYKQNEQKVIGIYGKCGGWFHKNHNKKCQNPLPNLTFFL